MLIVVLFVLVALVTALGVRSGRVTVRSCCSGPWPPDDLMAVEHPADASPEVLTRS